MKWNSTYIRKKGLLELYLLDELSDDDRRAVEGVLDRDPDLKLELTALEVQFEQLGLENAVIPPENIKSALLNRLDSPSVKSKEIPVISIDKIIKTPLYFYIAASLAAILLINSVWMYQNWQRAEKRLDAMTSETEGLQDQLAGLESKLKETADWFNMVNDPGSRKLVMSGNSLSPQSVAVVYLNSDDEKVMIKTDGLAELEPDKTYQVWADVEGEMIDMGVIPKGQDMVDLKYIAKAESLNITIEPAGGNDHPTVEALITNVLL